MIRQLTRYAAGHDLASLLITFRTHPRQVMQAAYQPQLLTTYDEKCEQLTTTGADYCLTLDFTTALAALSARRFMVEILKEKLSVKVLIIGYDHRSDMTVRRDLRNMWNMDGNWGWKSFVRTPLP